MELFSPKIKKKFMFFQKKTFQEMEFYSPELKKFLIFFLYFGRELSELEKQKKLTLKRFLISPPPKNFSYISGGNFLSSRNKNFIFFSLEKISYISGNGTF